MYPFAAEDITTTDFAPGVLGIYAEPANSPRMLIGVARAAGDAGDVWVVTVANTYETDRVVVDRDSIQLAVASICMRYADSYDSSELADAAICYAIAPKKRAISISELAKADARIAAEIDRLQRRQQNT